MRSDSKAFSEEEAENLLNGLDNFLSFVRGSSCAVTNVIGIGDDGGEAWKRWGAHAVSPWRGHRSWSDIHVIGALSDIFAVFWDDYKNSKNDLERVLGLYAYSNDVEVVDVSIILNQAALELLAFLTVGEEGKTGKRIAAALQKAGIDPQIPSFCEKLIALAEQKGYDHGPHALVGIRNSMIWIQNQPSTLLQSTLFTKPSNWACGTWNFCS